jgi:hypothetical protein
MPGNAQDIRAGGAFVELMLRDQGFSKGLAAAKEKLGNFAKGVALVGAAIATAGFAVLVSSVKQFVDMGSELNRMAGTTHKSVQDLSELKYAAEQTKVPFENIEKALVRTQKNGIDPAQFDSIAKGIASIKDPVQQTQAAIATWGKSGATLLPMLGSLQQLRQEARDSGLVMSGPAAKSASLLRSSFRELWDTIKMGAVVVGEAVAPFLEVALPIIQEFATGTLQYMQGVADGITDSHDSIIATLTGAWQTASDIFNGALTYIRQSVISAFEGVEFVINNWKTILQAAMISAELSVVTFANQTVYTFTELIPGYLSWFGNHWREVFTDILHITESVATNIWKNLANLWDAIEGLFNGEGFNFKWTPLTDGFKSAISELPKIAERELGPLEKSLQDQLNHVSDNLVQKFQEDHKAYADAEHAIAQCSPAKARSAFARAGGGGDVAGLIPDMEKKKKDIFTTFSAAALLAGGAGGGSDKVHKAITHQTTLQQKNHAELLKAIEDGGELDA